MESQCYLCETPIRFETEAQKILHLHQIHPNVKENIECVYCGKNFKYDYQIDNHLRSKGRAHRKSKSKSLNKKCLLCDKLFESPRAAHCHKIDVHRTFFECSLCKKVFNKQGKLRKHCKIDHDGKSLKCSKCTFTFTCVKNLKRHNFLRKCKPILEYID